MTELEQAEAALAAFKASMEEGHPWVSGAAFVNNPGLDNHILNAFQEFARVCKIAEQAKPAKRISLTEA